MHHKNIYIIFIIFTCLLFNIQKVFPSSTNPTIKEIMNNQDKFESFVKKNIQKVSFESRLDANNLLTKTTKGLYIHDKIKDSSFISEFIYRLIKSKSALPKFLSMFLNGEKFVYFTLIFIFTIICSSFLSEFEFSHKLFSVKRNVLMVIRLGVINALRVWSFFYIFGDHISPTISIYLGTISSLKLEYPILYKINFFLAIIS